MIGAVDQGSVAATMNFVDDRATTTKMTVPNFVADPKHPIQIIQMAMTEVEAHEVSLRVSEGTHRVSETTGEVAMIEAVTGDPETTAATDDHVRATDDRARIETTDDLHEMIEMSGDLGKTGMNDERRVRIVMIEEGVKNRHVMVNRVKLNHHEKHHVNHAQFHQLNDVNRVDH